MGLVENCLPNRKMRKEKKFNGKVRREAPHFTVLS